MGDQFSLLCKLFFASSAAWVMGRPVAMKVKGTPKEIAAVQDALVKSKSFVDELVNPAATVQSIADCLQAKHVAAKKFEEVMQVPWML